MCTSTMTMTLLEMLEYLQELVNNNMRSSMAFNQAWENYDSRTFTADISDSEIEEAVEFLESSHINGLNTIEMAEQLRERQGL